MEINPVSWDRGTGPSEALNQESVLFRRTLSICVRGARVDDVFGLSSHKVCNSVGCHLCSQSFLLFSAFHRIAEKFAALRPVDDCLDLYGVVTVASAMKIGFALFESNSDYSLTLPVIAGLTSATNGQFYLTLHLVLSLLLRSKFLPPLLQAQAAELSNNGETHWIAGSVPTRFSVGAVPGIEVGRGVRLSLILIAERFGT